MKHYFRMRIAKPGLDSTYFVESTTDMLDLSRQSYPRTPNGDVMLTEISREAYEKFREACEQMLARLEMNSLSQTYSSMLELVGES
jgi:hypothetical protein